MIRTQLFSCWKILLILLFLCLKTQGAIYPSTDNLGDVNCKALDFQQQLESLHMSNVDAWILIIGCSIALIIQLIFICLSIFVPRMRAQPGDLLFGAFCAESLLSIHWQKSGELSHAIYKLVSPDDPLDCDDSFCIINSLLSIGGGMMSALYNIMFFFFIAASMKDSLAVKGISCFSTHFMNFFLTIITLSILFGLGVNGKTLYGTCSFAADESLPMFSFIIYIFFFPLALIALIYFNKKIPNTQFYKKQRREFLRFAQGYLICTLILYGIISICNGALFLNCSYFHENYFSYFRSIGTSCKIIATITLPLLRMQDPYVRAIFREQSSIISNKISWRRNKSTKVSHNNSDNSTIQSDISQYNNKGSLEWPLNGNQQQLGISPTKNQIRKVNQEKHSAIEENINVFSRLNSGGSVIFDPRNKSSLLFKNNLASKQELRASADVESRVSTVSSKSSLFVDIQNKNINQIPEIISENQFNEQSLTPSELESHSNSSSHKGSSTDQDISSFGILNNNKIQNSNNDEMLSSSKQHKKSAIICSQRLKNISFNNIPEEVENQSIRVKKISLFHRTQKRQLSEVSIQKRPSLHKALHSETSRIKLQQRILNLLRNSTEVYEDQIFGQEKTRSSNHDYTPTQIGARESMWKTVFKWGEAFKEEDLNEEEAIKEKVQDMLKNAQIVDLFNDPFYKMDSSSSRSSSGGKHLDSIFGCDSSSIDSSKTELSLQAEVIEDSKEHFVRTLQRNIKMGVLCRIICGIRLHIMRKNNFCTKLDIFVESNLPSNKGKDFSPVVPRPSKLEYEGEQQNYDYSSNISSRDTFNQQSNDDNNTIPMYSQQTEQIDLNNNFNAKENQNKLINLKSDFVRSSNGTISPIKNLNFMPQELDEETSWLYLESKVYQYTNESIKSNLKNAPIQLLESDPFDVVRMKVFAPIIFHSLLRQEGFEMKIEDSFNLQSNLIQIKNASGSDGGKSGQFFFFSYDNKFLLKTVTPSELKILVKTLKPYFWHLKMNPQSLIAKIFGIYSFEGLNEKPIHLILMKNLAACKRQFIERTYDIKGSTYDRKVLPKKKDQIKRALNKMVMKDQDFLMLETVIKLPKEDRQKIFIQLEKDSLFFASQGLIDYSLIVFKVRKNQEGVQRTKSDREEELLVEEIEYFQFQSSEEIGIFYHIGIIDYLQLYTFKKKMEKYAKRFINFNFSLDTSSQDPPTYSKRFITFMKQILDV